MHRAMVLSAWLLACTASPAVAQEESEGHVSDEEAQALYTAGRAA